MSKLPTLIASIFASMLLSACATTSNTSSVENDLANIMNWWNGDYNNDRQLERLRANGQPIWQEDDSGKGGHIEVTSHYRPIAMPAFGEHVIYVEESKHGKPELIFRQRIYTLNIDEKTQSIIVKLWNFKDKKKYIGAWKDLSQLQALTPDDMSPLPDRCDLYVKRIDGKYHMPMRDKDCAFGSRYFNYQVLLGPDSFWFRDKIVNIEDENDVVTGGNFTYHELDKL